nr:AbrB family transcriptional regulator [Neoroseomonas terrae]
MCLLAGGLLSLLGLPLGWMIGAMIATGYLALRNAAAVPALARPAGLVVLGLALGQGFTRPVMEATAAALPAMLTGAVLVLAAGIAVAPLYRRLSASDGRTAFFATIPGGVVVMAALAGQAGAAVPAVMVAQSLRMALVVLAYPLLAGLLAGRGGGASPFGAALPGTHAPALALLLVAGAMVALLAARIRLPNAAMLAPCLLAMALSGSGVLPSSVPRWLVDAAQVAMGASLGLHLARDGLGGAPRRAMMASLVAGLTVSLLLLLAGLALGWGAGLPVAAVVLGLAPGGMPEMTVTAQALNLAVPLVLGFHLTRMVLCNLFVLPLWRGLAALGLFR